MKYSLIQQGISSLEILDTAVKVGIGALISGISTYLITKLQQKGDLEKERKERLSLLLQQVAEQIEETNHIYLKYWAVTSDAIRYVKAGEVISERKEKEREEIKSELFHTFKELTNAEAKLMLIGENNAAYLLREYGNLITDFRKTVVVAENPLSDSEIETKKDEIYSKRKLLFTELSEIYRRT